MATDHISDNIVGRSGEKGKQSSICTFNAPSGRMSKTAAAAQAAQARKPSTIVDGRQWTTAVSVLRGGDCRRSSVTACVSLYRRHYSLFPSLTYIRVSSPSCFFRFASPFRTSTVGYDVKEQKEADDDDDAGRSTVKKTRDWRQSNVICVYRIAPVVGSGDKRIRADIHSSTWPHAAYFIVVSRVVQSAGSTTVHDRHCRAGEVTTITEVEEETPRRLLPPRLLQFSSAKSGASSRAARLCARSGDRRRNNDSREVLLLRDHVVVDELPLPAAWCSSAWKKGARRLLEVDRKEEDCRGRETIRAPYSRWV